MWRSTFLALGITLCILGVECLVVEEAVLAGSMGAAASASDTGKQIQTAEWMPWVFMTVGAVTILYTITIPKRLQPG